MADLPRCFSRERWLRVIAVLAAACWIGVGWTSTNEFVGDIFSRDAWLICCGLAAGSALSLARWGSLHALQSYTIIAVSIGALRAIAYGSDHIYGPVWIWSVFALTTVAFYVAFAPHLAEHQRLRNLERREREDA